MPQTCKILRTKEQAEGSFVVRLFECGAVYFAFAADNVSILAKLS